MAPASIRSKKPDRKMPVPRQQPTGSSASESSHVQPISPYEDLHALIAKRAYDLYCERGFRPGSALDDWLEAEREILSQISPV